MNWKDAWWIVKGFRGARRYPELYQRVAMDFEIKMAAQRARSEANRKVYRDMQRRGGVP